MRNIIITGFSIIGLTMVGYFCYAQDARSNPDPVPQPPPGSRSNRLLPIPVGSDAWLMWDKWPQQRIGSRTYMRSTYDRAGGNESADAAHFLFMKQEDFNVALDVEGRGVLYFVRTNHWHGSPWHYLIDGKDNIVSETGTADPVNARQKFLHTTLLPDSAFPNPLNWTWGDTKGADLVWTPVAFEKSLRLAYSRTRYGTGYYIYQLYPDGTRISRPIKSWDVRQVPDRAVTNLIALAGTDIAPKNIRKITGILTLSKTTTRVAIIKNSINNTAVAPALSLRTLKFRFPIDKAGELERLHLRITWDGLEQPSVDAPICLFFGAGTLYNRDNREYLVKGFPVNIRFDYPAGKVELACYYPMPFFKSARIELTGFERVNFPSEKAKSGNIISEKANFQNSPIEYELRYEADSTPVNQNAYFHATYRDIPTPEPGKDMQFLDTKGIEGKENWSGNFVGTSFIFSHNADLSTLEGDPRFFFDDSQTPQAYGTGTEEWGGGGDYWGGRNMTLPFAGHPVGAQEKKSAKNEKDLIQSAYRFLLADLMPFGRRAVIRLEHGGENLSTEHYESVTYWYGLPAASIIRTDDLDIGSVKSEHEHAYRSPDASPVQSIVSRYEWGVDSLPGGKEVYPAHIEDGRYTRGVSEFTLKLNPDNLGALLRRTLDYSFPNQKAEVYIADAYSDKWDLAGTWYLAGSNTCVYSDPAGELDQRKYIVETSDRRFRDDEFLIPARFTAKRSAIKIQIRNIPDETPLYPGFPFPQQNAWSELRYQLFCFVMPGYTVK